MRELNVGRVNLSRPKEAQKRKSLQRLRCTLGVIRSWTR